MTQQVHADVIVVGAGTSGSYFAWRLSQAGFLTVVLEKKRLQDLGQDEVDYPFRQDLIFSGEDFYQMNLHYETEMSLGKTVSLGARLLWGVLSGRFSSASFRQLLAVSSTAGKIKALYRQFPESPAEFSTWLAKVKPL